MTRTANRGVRQFDRGSAFRRSAHLPESLFAARLRRLSVAARNNRSGLAIIFAGPSGTGKTMAAALARSLGKDLFHVDLSDMAEQYIGETEKNLAYALANARKRKAVLFFDEADALFGKRTRVKDSHDSYANLEVSHLLARIARHRGIVILSTNTPAEIDPVLMRQVRMVVTLPPTRE